LNLGTLLELYWNSIGTLSIEKEKYIDWTADRRGTTELGVALQI
jgi:hypothetical protein